MDGLIVPLAIMQLILVSGRSMFSSIFINMVEYVDRLMLLENNSFIYNVKNIFWMYLHVGKKTRSTKVRA